MILKIFFFFLAFTLLYHSVCRSCQAFVRNSVDEVSNTVLEQSDSLPYSLTHFFLKTFLSARIYSAIDLVA